jgi:predicted Zn-dependent protease
MTLKRVRLFIFCLAIGCAAIANAPMAFAQGGFSFIRDTEIENTIRVYVTPLFEAAGLDPSAVSVHIINDRSLNAFVAGGQRIFIHIGLLMKAETPGEVIGVLAHEIGHITGGHLSRKHKNLENANNQSIIALVLGGAAALAAGSADPLIAGALAKETVGRRSFLAYNRSMEQSADQAALSFLEATGQSAQGLHDFLALLMEQEKLYSAGGNPYSRSHPLNADRLRHVEEHLRKSPFSQSKTTEMLNSMHRRMRGKLKGFINPPDQTLREYDAGDPDFGARYARAVALSKLQETDAAIAIIDELIAVSPKDPFFHELKGELLVDGGRTQEAIEPFKKALTILPWAALIKVGLAQIQLENNDTADLEAARDNLKEALRYEPELTGAWRFLATAEGKLGNAGGASLALAEEALLRGNKGSALSHVKRAMASLPEGSPSWFRAQDIESAAQKTE